MRTLLVVLFCMLSSITTAATARAAPDPGLVVAVFPPVVEGTGVKERQYMALLIQAHAVELLVATGRYRDLHVKQIRRLAEHAGWDPARSFRNKEQALPAASRLGADRMAFGELLFQNGGYRLLAHAARVDPRPAGRDAKVTQDELTLPLDKLEAVRAGGRRLAELVARLDNVTLPASVPGVTSARSEKVLYTSGRCYAALVDESFRSDSPGLLSPSVLAGAWQSCNEAVQSDPDLIAAQAARGLADVLLAAQGGDRERAKKAFAALQQHLPAENDYEPFYWMALYWLAAHFEPSSDTATQVLREALRRHPGSLILHAFLGRHLNLLNAYPAAEKEWREYLRLTPRSPYVMGQLSYTLARLGRHDEAKQLAQQACALDPADREAQMTLASRYLDDKEWDRAVRLLSALVQTGPRDDHSEVGAEIRLRLGWAYMNLPSPDLAAAERYLKQAEAAATQPDGWRTRARAEMDLARIYQQRGQDAAAKEAVAKFEKYASPLYVQRQVARDEVLRKLQNELRTDETALHFPLAPPARLTSVPPGREAPSVGARELCSKVAGICFQLGAPGGPPDRKTLPPPGQQGRSPFGAQ